MSFEAGAECRGDALSRELTCSFPSSSDALSAAQRRNISIQDTGSTSKSDLHYMEALERSFARERGVNAKL